MAPKANMKLEHKNKITKQLLHFAEKDLCASATVKPTKTKSLTLLEKAKLRKKEANGTLKNIRYLQKNNTKKKVKQQKIMTQILACTEFKK